MTGLTKVRNEWVVYSYATGLNGVTTEQVWRRYKDAILKPNLKLVATGLTKEQADAMVKLSRSEE